MAREAWDTLVAYKLVWVRVAFFMFSPMIAGFLSINQTVDMDSKWTSMGIFSKWAFWLGLAYPGLMAMIAFIDQSLQRTNKEQEIKRSGNTQFLSRSDTGP